LKLKLEDMKMTALHNKELLKDYIEGITGKDKIVQKMQNTIETLSERTKVQEEVIKKLLNQNKEYLNIINQFKTHVPSKTEENLDNSRQDSQNSAISPYTTSLSYNNFTNPNHRDVFTKKQNLIMNEINQFKYDFKFIVEKYEELSKLYMKKNKEKQIDDLNVSMNESMISDLSTNTVVQKRVNMKKKFANGDNLQKVLSSYDDDSVILFIDGKNEIWEIVRRYDISLNMMKCPEKLHSITKKYNVETKLFNNIEIKDLNSSLNMSYLNTGKDINISALLKDC